MGRARAKRANPRPKQSRLEHGKREAILHAALHLFAARGYYGTTVPEVAEYAGVGAGTVYRYFASKEALVNALFREWKMKLAEALMANFPFGATIREQFREVWNRLAQFAAEQPHALDFLELHHHRSYLDADSLAVEDQMMAPLRAFAEEARRQQIIKPIKPEILAALVYGGFMGLVSWTRKGKLKLDAATLRHGEECLWEAIRR